MLRFDISNGTQHKERVPIYHDTRVLKVPTGAPSTLYQMQKLFHIYFFQ